MTIDDAIELLNAEKKKGVTHVILSHWTAQDFGLLELDASWPDITEMVEDGDWDRVNNHVEQLVETAQQYYRGAGPTNNTQETD